MDQNYQSLSIRPTLVVVTIQQRLILLIILMVKHIIVMLEYGLAVAEETECRLLLSPTPATTDNVYEPTLNEKPYLYYQIQNGSLNGSDGCCGDDIPSCL